MTSDKPMRLISQRDLTPDESLWLDVRADAIKQTPARVADALNRLVVLATALSGGAVAGLKNDVCDPWGRVAAAALFLGALLAAVVGSVPRDAVLPTFPAADIRTAVRRVVAFKEACARVALVLIAAGMVAAVVGTAVAAAAGLAP